MIFDFRVALSFIHKDFATILIDEISDLWQKLFRIKYSIRADAFFDDIDAPVFAFSVCFCDSEAWWQFDFLFHSKKKGHFERDAQKVTFVLLIKIKV